MIGLIDRALALNPSFARGWYLSGILRIWAGQHDLAIEHLETSLRLSPRERIGPPLSMIGMAYFFKRQFDEAAAKLLLAIQDNPGSPTPYRFLAACYAHMGRLDEARATSPSCAPSTSGRAERSALPQPRGPRAVPVGPAARYGQRPISPTLRLASIASLSATSGRIYRMARPVWTRAAAAPVASHRRRRAPFMPRTAPKPPIPH